MATNSPGGSHLAQLAAKRKKIDAARQQLRMGGDPARPQSNVRAPAPTPEAPGQPPESAESQTTRRQATTAGGEVNPQREEMRRQADEFLMRAKASQSGSSGGPDGEIAPAPDTLTTAPPSVPAPLGDQLARVGATQLSPIAQFMRLAGRPPSGRELYVFNAVRSLEQQLGRPPTRNEVLLHVTARGEATRGPDSVM